MDDYDPLSQLALLAPKAVDLNHMPVAWSRLTPYDVAAKLAKVSNGASLLGRVKIAGQNELRRSLVFLVVPKVVNSFISAFPEHIGATPIGPAGSNAQLYMFIEEAMREVLDPRVCGPCKGHKFFPETDQDGRETGRFFPCQFCGGTGHHRHSERSRAKALGYPKTTWNRRNKNQTTSYSQFYADILTVLYGFDKELREVFI